MANQIISTPGINSLQWQKQRFTGDDFTDTISLSDALLIEPAIAQTITYSLGEKFLMSYLTEGSGRLSENYNLIGSSEYRWALQGNYLTAIPITIASTLAEPGRGFSEFTIGLATKYFALGDIIKFGSGTSFQLARVQRDPIAQGNSFIYTLQLVTSDHTEFLKAAYNTVGFEVAWVSAAFEEGSRGGSSKEATPMWFRNQLTTTRMQWGMTGSAQTEVMVLSFLNAKGEKSRLWMYEKEYQFMMQWAAQKERMHWYAKYNRTPSGEVHLPGQNGRPVLMGAGLFEQIAGTNKRNYSTLTENILRDYLGDLQLQAKDAENSNFVMMTGLDGMDQFNESMRSAITASQVIDTQFLMKNGNGKLKFAPNTTTTYQGLLGTTLTVMYNPMFDDKEFHTETNPETGRPLESSRMVFLDFGNYGGESNISMIAKGADGINRSMVTWCTAGSQTPDGGSLTSKQIRSSDLDGWQCHYLSETGIKLLNPLSCGELNKIIA